MTTRDISNMLLEVVRKFGGGEFLAPKQVEEVAVDEESRRLVADVQRQVREVQAYVTGVRRGVASQLSEAQEALSRDVERAKAQAPPRPCLLAPEALRREQEDRNRARQELTRKVRAALSEKAARDAEEKRRLSLTLPTGSPEVAVFLDAVRDDYNDLKRRDAEVVAARDRLVFQLEYFRARLAEEHRPASREEAWEGIAEFLEEIGCDDAAALWRELRG